MNFLANPIFSYAFYLFVSINQSPWYPFLIHFLQRAAVIRNVEKMISSVYTSPKLFMVFFALGSAYVPKSMTDELLG